MSRSRQDAHPWANGRASRRAVLRAGGLGIAGLVGAALIGCGDDDDEEEPAAQRPTATPTRAAAATAEARAVEPKRGGRLTVDSKDPNPRVIIFGFNSRNRYIKSGVWEPLIGIGAGYTPYNVLAESFVMKPDNTGATARLKPGLRFHDGRPVTGEDIVASIDFFSNDDARGQLKNALGRGVANVRLVDDRTVEMEFNGPQPALIDTFTLMNIIDVNTIGTVEEFKVMNGTGPFKFVQYTPAESWTLERNEDYRQEGLPYLDGIDGVVFADDEARVLALQTGEIEHSNAVTLAMAARLMDADGVKLAGTGKGGHTHLGLVVDEPPFDDIRVRQAAGFALDRERYAAEYAEGLTPATTLPWPKDSPYFFAEDEALMRYDPEHARQLLEQAGAAGATATIAVTPGANTDLGVLIQNDLKAVGFDIELVTFEPANWLSQLRGKKWETNAWIGLHGFANFMHPATLTNTAQQFPIPNPSHYAPPGYQELLDALAASDPSTEDGMRLIREFNRRHVLEDPWLLGMLSTDGFRAMRSNINGDPGVIDGQRFGDRAPHLLWIDA